MTKVTHRIYVSSFTVITIASLALLIYNGLDYYSLSNLDKPFSSKYELLKPSGYLGHGLGILGTLMMMIGVFSYMIRKRVKKLFGLGYLTHWLEFHIFMCVLGPIFVLFHTAFKFGGIVSVSFWSMVAVVLSGVIGRYIYIQIPRSIEGNELGMQEIDELNRNLSQKLKSEANLSPGIIGKIDALIEIDKFKNFKFTDGLVYLFNDYFKLHVTLRQFKNELIVAGVTPEITKKTVLPVIRTKLILLRRIGLLKTMQKLFRYWHIFHLPFAITMFIIMIVHVVVTITFGYRWIF